MATASFSNTSFSNLQTAAAPQEDEKIWTNLLSEVTSKSSNTLQGGAVIILGDSRSGKTSLLMKLEKTESTKPSSFLEYHTLNLQNDFRDSSYAYQLGTAGLGTADNLILPVWTLGGNEAFSSMLQYALPKSSPSKTVVVLTAAINNPGLIHSLRRWALVISEQVNKKYDKETILEAKKQQERYWQEYVEPMDCSMSASMAISAEDTGLLPLAKGILTDNCGVNFVVVITKSDLGSELSDQQADKLLIQIRHLCLQLGAALIYTSANNQKNTQLLYKYIAHRAFGAPCGQPAQLIERDSLFVPAGWDTEAKIDLIKEGIDDTDVPLEPTREKPTLIREQPLEAEEEQKFLEKLLEKSAQAVPPGAQPSLAAAPAVSAVKKPLVDDDDSKSPLANFFSNLLKDKPGTSPNRPSLAPQDMAAALERMSKDVSKDSAPSDSTA